MFLPTLSITTPAQHHASLWRALAVGAATLLTMLLAVPEAMAQPLSEQVRGKLAPELRGDLGAVANAWTRDVGGKRQVQMVVVSNSDDPELDDLRDQVLRLGGAVHARLPLVRSLSVQLPADKLALLAAHSDVQGLSPNRSVSRTASALEFASGVLTPNVRSYSSTSAYTGLDGKGVGIAVMDSGVMRAHRHFLDAGGFNSCSAMSICAMPASAGGWGV